MSQQPEDTSGVHVWLILMKAYRALLDHAQANIRELDLCDSDFFVLEVLLHKGPLPVNTIGQKVHLTSGSISVAVDRLVSRGLVERLQHVPDRRVRLVQLTEGGRKLIDSAFKKHADAMERATAGFPHPQRSALMVLLKQLGKDAQATPTTVPASH